jgi:PTH2 family peptidyl-tRNA hydrolase
MTKTYDLKQVIVVRKDLNMRKGKIAAQAAHAVLNSFLDGGSHDACTISLTATDIEWLRTGATKICVYVESENELQEIYHKASLAKLPCSIVTDAGFTEFHGVPTKTVVAVGPARSADIDKITGHLKLL